MITKPDYPGSDALFGDKSLGVCVSETRGTEAGRLFAKGLELMTSGDKQSARKTFEEIGKMRNIESRYRLQAWYFFRQAGGQPPSSLSKEILGVVAEVGLDDGLDLLAAYADRTAYYYNYSGAGVIWKRPDSSLDRFIDAVIRAASAVLPHIGPWNEPRRPPPATGSIRLNILTPVGLHFGEGPFDAMDRDKLARPLVQATTDLMRKLTLLPSGQKDVASQH